MTMAWRSVAAVVTVAAVLAVRGGQGQIGGGKGHMGARDWARGPWASAVLHGGLSGGNPRPGPLLDSQACPCEAFAPRVLSSRGASLKAPGRALQRAAYEPSPLDPSVLVGQASVVVLVSAAAASVW